MTGPADPPCGEDEDLALAAAWFSRTRSGAMSEEERASMEAWLASEEHRQAYARVGAMWEAAGRLNADPAVMAMREKALARHPAPRRRLALAAGLAALVLVGGGLAAYLGSTADPPFQTFRTGVGQTAKIALIDGSLVTLDTNTVLRTRITSRGRQIFLDHGRAYFNVAKDKSRPFVVEAAGKSVTATGTAFEVTSEGRTFEVLLVEGRVRVAAPAVKAAGASKTPVSADLTPGTRLAVTGSGSWSLTQAEDLDSLAWMNGQLLFDNRPLAEIVAQMNRYSRRKIVIEDPVVAQRTVYGAFTANDPDQFVRALVDYGIVRIRRADETSISLIGAQQIQAAR